MDVHSRLRGVPYPKCAGWVSGLTCNQAKQMRLYNTKLKLQTVRSFYLPQSHFCSAAAIPALQQHALQCQQPKQRSGLGSPHWISVCLIKVASIDLCMHRQARQSHHSSDYTCRKEHLPLMLTHAHSCMMKNKSYFLACVATKVPPASMTVSFTLRF